MSQLSNKSLSETFNKAVDFTKAVYDSDAKFEYGWCETDHKDGKKIIDDYRSIDFMKDDSYALYVKGALKKIWVTIST